MGKRNQKRLNYRNLRKKKRSKHDNVEWNRLEKLEKASYGSKLKVRIELRLKKLTHVINL